MNRRSLGQYIPGTSWLHRMNRRIKLLSFLIFLVFILAARGPVWYGAVFLGCLGIALTIGIPFRRVIEPVKELWGFFLMIFLMNTFFFDSTDVLWKWWIFQPSISGIHQGLHVIYNVILVMVVSNVFLMTTSPIDITKSLTWLITPLKIIFIPVDEIAMILSVAMQFIPILMEEAYQVKQAQISRGARFESKKLRERAVSYLPLIVPIFLAAFRRGDELAQAMEARGYQDRKQKLRIGKGRNKKRLKQEKVRVDEDKNRNELE